MRPIIRKDDVTIQSFEKCHDGEGTLYCRSMLKNTEKALLGMFHVDDMPSGVSIGEHQHEVNEELYFLVSGEGVLTFDGADYEMTAGDISLCGIGHSHGFLAKTDCRLIVVGSTKLPR